MSFDNELYSCITIGVHYWLDATRDMSCDRFFPVFLLYNGGVLNAFGWAFQADLSSSRYEHPSHASFAVSLSPDWQFFLVFENVEVHHC